MNRKILFDKKKDGTPSNTIKETSVAAPKKATEIFGDTPKKSPTLLEWLQTHDLIKIRTLCLKAGVDPGSFHRWMNVTKEIPLQAIEKITPILKDYGYAL